MGRRSRSWAFPALRSTSGSKGAGSIVLRDWNLGSNAFVAQDGVHGVYPGSSGTAGARVGVQVVPRLAIEGEIEWVGLPNALDSSQGLTYGLNVPFHILKGDWTPIVEAGFGAYQVISGKLGAAVEARGHLGIGVRGKLSDRIGSAPKCATSSPAASTADPPTTWKRSSGSTSRYGAIADCAGLRRRDLVGLAPSWTLRGRDQRNRFMMKNAGTTITKRSAQMSFRQS